MVNGLVTFRSYRKFDYFRIQFMEALESLTNSTFCNNITNRWMGDILDLVCVYITICTLFYCSKELFHLTCLSFLSRSRWMSWSFSRSRSDLARRSITTCLAHRRSTSTRSWSWRTSSSKRLTRSSLWTVTGHHEVKLNSKTYS